MNSIDNIDWDGALSNDWDRYCEEECDKERRMMDDEADREKKETNRFHQWTLKIDLDDQATHSAAQKIVEALRQWHSYVECVNMDAWE